MFHYTTAEGLKGILEQNELWASSAYFLNDAAEITYGYGVLKEVLNEWIASSGRSDQSLTLGLAKDLLKGFGDDLLNMNIVDPIYLACFCEEDNLLSQWRAYGQTGGYSLGFNFSPPDVARTLKPEPNIYTGRLTIVDYDRKAQMIRCKGILDTVLPIFDNPEVARAVPELGPHGIFGYDAMRRIIADILMEEVVGFKEKAFEVEKEWRLVIRRREMMKQGTDDGGKTPVPVHFRSSKGMLIPYIKLIPNRENAKIPLAVVRSGPALDGLTASMSIRLILDKHGYDGVRTAVSGITARF